MHVDQLLSLKLTINELFFPIIPTYEERIENSSEEKERKREKKKRATKN